MLCHEIKKLGQKITAAIASREADVTRVVRHERPTTLAVSVGGRHARSLGVSAVLTLAPGCSP